MKTWTQIVILSVLAVSVNFSCSKSPKCWGKDKNEGDISELLKITCPPISGDRWVIQNQAAYEQLFDSSCFLPAVDFNNYTLLGLYTTGGCETKYIREVEQSDEGGTHCKITVKSCGSCKKLTVSYNWVSIPKIPKNAIVSFEVVEK